MTFFHGSYKPINQLTDRYIWFANTPEKANDYILSQANGEEIGEFGHLYKCEISEELIGIEDDFDLVDSGDTTIDKPYIFHKQSGYLFARSANGLSLVETDGF